MVDMLTIYLTYGIGLIALITLTLCGFLCYQLRKRTQLEEEYRSETGIGYPTARSSSSRSKERFRFDPEVDLCAKCRAKMLRNMTRRPPVPRPSSRCVHLKEADAAINDALASSTSTSTSGSTINKKYDLIYVSMLFYSVVVVAYCYRYLIT